MQLLGFSCLLPFCGEKGIYMFNELLGLLTANSAAGGRELS